MKKYFYFIGFFALHILFVSNLMSQSLILTGIDASKFPLIKANVEAVDGFGNSYKDLSKNDFTVLENLKNMKTTLGLNCSTAPQDLAIVLVVDVSTSMKEPIDTVKPVPSENRTKYVNLGVRSFLGSVDFSRRTVAGLITFSTFASLRQPFTRDTSKLNDSLRKTWIAGTTKYDPPLLDTTEGAFKLFRTLPDSLSDLKKIIVFLTDGDPEVTPKYDEIIKYCKENSIQMFAITFMNPMVPVLEKISNESGGKSFAVLNKDDLEKIYGVIAAEIQKRSVCQLTWLSAFSCDEQSYVRDVEIAFLRGTNNNCYAKRKYFAPPQSVAKLKFSETVLSFGNPDINVPVSKTFTIKPQYSDFTIGTFDFSPSVGYFRVISMSYNGKQVVKGAVIPADSILLLEVEFTQLVDKSFRQANFIANGLPCSSSLILYGGYSNVTLIEPNGGEIYKTCDVVNIKWSGVEPETLVNIYYTTNNGTTWILIAKDQSNLNYNWVNLPPAGTKYKIKLEVLATSQYRYAKSFGNDKIQNGRGIDMTPDQLYLWTTGWYQGTQMDIGTKTLVNAGDYDIFVAKFNTDGVMKEAFTAGGIGRDTATAICVDYKGDAYITGSIQKGAKFEGQNLNLAQTGKNYFFVAKYSNSGDAPIVKFFGADNIYTSFEAWGTKIRYDVLSNKIIVGGYLKNQVLGNIDGVPYSFPVNPTPSQFNAELQLDLTFTKIAAGAATGVFTSDSVRSKDSSQVYKIGSFSGNKTFGSFNVTSLGLTDVWISKFGKNQGSVDTSDNTFSIETPVLKFSSPTFDVGDATYGMPKDVIANLILYNPTSAAIQIDSTSFIANNKGEFKLTNLSPTFIAAKDSISISFKFTPLLTGKRVDKFKVYGKCAAVVTLDLVGNGVCNSIATSSVDLGKINLGIPKTNTFKTIFTNPNQANLRINPIIVNGAVNEFKIISTTSSVSSKVYDITGPYDVDPGDILDFVIEFKPDSEGVRNAQIDYQVQSAGCVNSITNLTGVGVNSALILRPVSYGLKRLKSLNKKDLVVINTSVNSAQIDTVWTDNLFFKVSTTTYPKTIKGKDSIGVAVEFKPTAEVTYNGLVFVKYNNGTKIDTTTLDGIGSNPQLIAQLICPTNITKEGEEGDATLKIFNNSINTETIIKSIRFANSSEFTFANGSSIKTNSPNLATNGKALILDVKFKPLKPGKICSDIIFDSDIALGNEIDDLYPSTTITATNQCCTAMSAGGEIPVDFGDMLACETNVIQFPITNNSNNSLTIFGGAPFTGPNPSYFKHDIDVNGMNVAPGDTKFFNLTFSPTESKPYSAFLELANNQNLKIKYVITGNGHFIKLYSSKLNDVNVTPGTVTSLYVSADIPKLTKGAINNLNISILYDENIVEFKNDTAKSTLSNWKWDKPIKVSKGHLEIKGAGILNTPFKDDLFTIPYTIFLGDIDKAVISLQNLSTCATPVDTSVNVKLTGVCFVKGRLVDVGVTNYFLTLPNPNPANSVSKIQIGLAFEADTRLEIVNYLGEVVKILENNTIKAGIYEYSIPTDELNSGVYQIRYTSGFFSKSQPLIIQK
jgi:Mg-chelatase subunit ChlD